MESVVRNVVLRWLMRDGDTFQGLEARPYYPQNKRLKVHYRKRYNRTALMGALAPCCLKRGGPCLCGLQCSSARTNRRDGTSKMTCSILRFRTRGHVCTTGSFTVTWQEAQPTMLPWTCVQYTASELSPCFSGACTWPYNIYFNMKKTACDTWTTRCRCTIVLYQYSGAAVVPLKYAERVSWSAVPSGNHL